MVKIKAIIYDLDDTLYDCTNTLVDAARKRAAKAMIKDGLPLTEEQAYKRIIETEKKYGKRANIFEKICDELNIDRKIGEKGLDAYNADIVEDIKLFPDVLSTLNKLRGLKHILLTTGRKSRQKLKIKKLGIQNKFDYINFNNNLDENIPKIKIDGEQFRQVLLNLYANAANAMKKGDIYNAYTMDDERDRITQLLRNQGVLLFQ